MQAKNVQSYIVEAHGSASTPSMSTKIVSTLRETHCRAPLRKYNANQFELIS